MKSSVQFDSLKIIQQIPITDANYEIAWDLLKGRFNNKRDLIKSLIKKLISQPQTYDSVSTNKWIRSLKVLEQKVEGFGETHIAYLLVEQLHKNTRASWDRKFKKVEFGSINQFFNFL